MKRLCQRIALFVPISASLVAAACVPPQHRLMPVTDRGALIMRLGPDTMFVERFELSPNRMYVESVLRAPTVVFRTIDAALNPDGSLSSMVVATFDPAHPRGGSARDSATITFSADSTIYDLGIGARRDFLRLPGRGDLVISIPGNLWFPNYALLAKRAPRATGDSLIGTMALRLGAYPLVMKRVTRDTLNVRSQISGMMRVILAPDGRLAALDGTGSSIPYVGSRVDWINIDSVSRVFAERERATKAVGILSARDTAEAEISGAHLAVDYGRPSKRGRQIFGNVVPWNVLWRTGANLATHFSTSRDLQFGGELVQAGTYTLHTIPAPNSWTLLVSRQTGQWGTAALDSAMIVARVPMRVRESSEVTETFTITIVPEGAGGLIRLAWDTTLAEARFTIP